MLEMYALLITVRCENFWGILKVFAARIKQVFLSALMETRARASKSTNRASLNHLVRLVYAVWTVAISFANLVR